MYGKKVLIRSFYHTAEKLDFISSFSYFRLERVLKIFTCLVKRYTRTNLIWKSCVRDFCFGSSSVHHATPFSKKEVSFLYLSCFRNIQPVKTILAPEDEYCFLLLLLQAIVIIMGIALINAKAKSVIVFAIILFSWSIEGDS